MVQTFPGTMDDYLAYVQGEQRRDRLEREQYERDCQMFCAHGRHMRQTCQECCGAMMHPDGGESLFDRNWHDIVAEQGKQCGGCGWKVPDSRPAPTDGFVTVSEFVAALKRFHAQTG